jgi:type VI secretion system protein ImpB
MAESTHAKLSRVRKPHVHITYEVFKGDAVEVRELPFVVGVLGDFSGNPTTPLKPLRDREFVAIDRDNFDEIMRRMTPGLNFKAENTLANDGTEMGVQLKFESMDDFSPANVAKQVPALKKLLETREQLQALRDKADRSDKLEGLLEQILTNSDEIKKASGQIDGEKK